MLSKLDSSTSLVPLAVKDAATVAGLVTMAYKTGGQDEAREKFIDETGTTALWLGGIPFFRKLYDKIVFKNNGLDPDISIKKIFNKSPQQLAYRELREHTKNLGKLTENQLDNSKQLLNNYKKLHTNKFLASTIISTLLILVLPKLNQRLSRKIILTRELRDRESNNNSYFAGKSDVIANSPISFEKNKSSKTAATSSSSNLKEIQDNFIKNTTPQVNFSQNNNTKNKAGFAGMGSLLTAAASAQNNPVGNILLVDAAISGNRVTFVPRNNQQRAENFVKEGGFIFFAFIAQGLIKKGFEKISEKLKVPVDLDFKTLNSDSFKAKMKDYHNNKITRDALTKISDISEHADHEGKVYEFIKGNVHKDEFLTLQTAKEVGIIKTDKATGALNPKKYIEINEVKKLSENIGKFADAMTEAGKKSGISPESFINKAHNVKAGFLFANLAICCSALGIVLPKIQYAFRDKVYKSKDYPGIKGYKEEAEKLAATSLKRN